MTETSFTKEKENIRRQVDAAEFDRISMEIAKTIQKEQQQKQAEAYKKTDSDSEKNKAYLETSQPLPQRHVIPDSHFSALSSLTFDFENSLTDFQDELQESIQQALESNVISQTTADQIKKVIDLPLEEISVQEKMEDRFRQLVRPQPSVSVLDEELKQMAPVFRPQATQLWKMGKDAVNERSVDIDQALAASVLFDVYANRFTQQCGDAISLAQCAGFLENYFLPAFNRSFANLFSRSYSPRFFQPMAYWRRSNDEALERETLTTSMGL
ncbi:COXBURSA331_A2190 family Dot/Icm T4SS effector [Coxiella burnetii]|uniref:COXBURSA331_A2190 family Dot/Icm T4SS effector n=1 Tax=Coxiella burnetii TaxID=777 RepID=UPI0000ECFDFD|nr:COXBURSA331_A2190 family Dot/Icm T4SS effector [Coxiella burnetii]AIT62546.1 putative cytosolic protein [Coxiella burnetii str. Namibia]ATN85163.1 hypothetical protein AYO29_00870 [Coxiella burnetii str. Schperling]EAX33894.1 hypothetical protein A35_00995 [Coxiella burnetii 'MSU Goat Q177']EDR35651.1 hypothetical protein COXBURSA334_0057 [Coxiella burnetii Q321]PHH56870.1 hypothetical protein CRH12_08395 [Coxiella burnetii]